MSFSKCYLMLQMLKRSFNLLGVIGQWLSLNQVGFGFCGTNPGSLSDMEDDSAGHSLSLPFL